MVGKNNGVILGVYSLPKKDYDGHASESTLAQVERGAGQGVWFESLVSL